jgi:hypothetical protein
MVPSLESSFLHYEHKVEPKNWITDTTNLGFLGALAQNL